MADTSLIFKIIARDQTSAVMAKLKRTAESTGSFVAKALGGPALAPVMAAAGTAVLGFGASLGAAGLAAGVFGAVTKSAMTDVTEAATKVEDLRDKIELYNRQAKMAGEYGMESAKYTKKAAEANLQLQARLANLPPATRDATMAYLDMKSGWESFVESNKPAVFNLLGRGYKLIGNVIGRLQPLFDIGRMAASRLMGAMQRTVDGGFLERMSDRALPAVNSLWKIIVNVTTALGNMMGRSASQGQGLLDWIERMTGRWAEWAKATEGESGFHKFMAYSQQHGPTVVAMLTSLASAAVNIAQAVAPLAPVSLAIASALASLIAAVPPSVITAIVAAFIAFNVAMKVLAVVQAIATAAQWAMNIAMMANPVGLFVAAILVLIGIIVLIATKTTWFQTIWKHVWGFMKAVGAWFAGPFANFFVVLWGKITASLNRAKGQFFTVIGAIKGFFVGWWNLYAKIGGWIINKGVQIVRFFVSMPGKIRGALSGMFSPLWDGFKRMVNRVIYAWNRLGFSIGGGSFAGIDIPSARFDTPDIPYLATGGEIQRTGLMVGHKGERITKAAVARRTGPGTGTGGGGGSVIRIEGDNAKVVRVLLELLREGIRDKGGDPVKVLTPR